MEFVGVAWNYMPVHYGDIIVIKFNHDSNEVVVA